MDSVSDDDENDCGDGYIADANQTVKVSRPKQPKMMNFLDNISASDATIIDIAIAEFFNGCNIKKWSKLFMNQSNCQRENSMSV